MEMISEVVAQIKKNPTLAMVEDILIQMIHDFGERKLLKFKLFPI